MKDQPNVIVLVTDTYRPDHIAANGHPTVRTPELDYPYWEGGPFDTARHSPQGGLAEGGNVLYNDDAAVWSNRFALRTRRYGWFMALPE